ncbi:MAG: group 1 truncated hemoglobin [Oleiphilus sp.]|nr:MAG: group 1 truncated hemoglobin [Oleiphilus sp.]
MNHDFRSMLLITLLSLNLGACASQPKSLYEEFGGQDKVEAVTEYLIDEIGYDKTIYAFFADTDIDRFRKKFSEHICEQLGGPCKYTGDNMKLSHRGMGISEADFNRLVDLLIHAMDRASISYTLQNRLLAKLAPMRRDVLEQE